MLVASRSSGIGVFFEVVISVTQTLYVILRLLYSYLNYRGWTRCWAQRLLLLIINRLLWLFLCEEFRWYFESIQWDWILKQYLFWCFAYYWLWSGIVGWFVIFLLVIGLSWEIIVNYDWLHFGDRSFFILVFWRM